MNRGPFIHGMYRYSEVNNKKNRRYRRVSLRRTVINLIFFALGIALVVFVLLRGMAEIFLIGAAFFLGLCSIPITLSLGKNMLIHEVNIATNQKRADLPLDFNRRKAIWGYILSFAPTYLLMLGCFFIPAKNACIVPLIPLTMCNLITVLLTYHTAEALDFSGRKYKAIHTLTYLFIFVAGNILRGLIIYPIIYN